MADAERKILVTPTMKDRASKGLERLGLVGRKAGDSIAAGFIKAQLALGAMKAIARGTINVLRSITTGAAEQGDTLNKLSTRLGIAVETLSSLGYAAELGGSNVETMGDALKDLSTRVYDAVRGGGEAVDIFKSFGIELTDSTGKLRDTEDLFFDVADAVAGMDDKLSRAAVAQKLLGESGLRLVPVLEQGSAAIREQQQEADRLGVTWSQTSANLASAFVTAQSRLTRAIEGIRNAIAVELFPGLTTWLENLAKNLSDNRDKIVSVAVNLLETVSSALWSAFRWAAESLARLADGIEKIVETIPGVTSGREDRASKIRAQIDALNARDRAIGWVVMGTPEEIATREERAKIQRDIADLLKQLAELNRPLVDQVRAALDEVEKGFAEGVKKIREAGSGGSKEQANQRLPETVVEGEGVGFFDGISKGAKDMVAAMNKAQGSIFDFGRVVGETLIGGAAQGFANFFDAIVTGAGNASDAFRAMAVDIGRALTQLATTRLFTQLLNLIPGIGGGVPGDVGQIPLPVTAAGGVVFGAQARIVGEQGPEAIVPLSKWDAMTRGGGGDIYVTVNAPSNVDANAVKALARQGVMEATQDYSFRKFMRGRLGRGL